jgi:multicomponent Na+:H+ antiporter subunit E
MPSGRSVRAVRVLTVTGSTEKMGKESAVRTTAVARRIVAYGCLWSLLWWLLSGGAAESWLVGGPTVLAAAAMSAWLAPVAPWRWTVGGLARFSWHFGLASLLGGVDVAWRAIHPRLPIDPRMLNYRSRLPAGTARIFFANVVSLCPGTVSAHVRDDVLRIHVLDARQPVRARLDDLERAVAALFGVQLTPLDASRAGEP